MSSCRTQPYEKLPLDLSKVRDGKTRTVIGGDAIYVESITKDATLTVRVDSPKNDELDLKESGGYRYLKFGETFSELYFKNDAQAGKSATLYILRKGTQFLKGADFLITNIENMERLELIDLIEEITKILNIKTIETIENIPDLTPHGSEGIAFKQATAGTGSWLTPTGHEEESGWSDETKAYDESLPTYAYDGYLPSAGWGNFLILTHSAVACNKLRIYAETSGYNPLVDIDVFKDGEWMNVYEGTFPDEEWMPKAFTQGSVTKVRIRFYNNTGYIYQPRLYEVDFWEVTGTGGDMIIQELGRLESPPENTQITKKAYAYDEDDDIETVKFYEGENLLFTLTYGYDGSKNITTITRS